MEHQEKFLWLSYIFELGKCFYFAQSAFNNLRLSRYGIVLFRASHYLNRSVQVAL